MASSRIISASSMGPVTGSQQRSNSPAAGGRPLNCASRTRGSILWLPWTAQLPKPHWQDCVFASTAAGGTAPAAVPGPTRRLSPSWGRRPSDGAPSLVARDGTSAAPLRRRNLFELPAQGPGRSPLSLCHGHTGLRRPGLNQAGSGGLSDSARPRRGPAIMRQRVWRIWPVAPGPPPGRRRGRAPSPVHSVTGTVRVP